MRKFTFLLFIALFTFSSDGWGQILTFEFSGLAGGEATAPSNSNDANLTSATITRGTGLTASNNAGRFNATSWALTSIANAVTGDDYMEFIITPNSGYQFDVTSIYIQLQRSGTGPRGIVLRNSLDSYSSNLDIEYAITDNTSTQNFTFTFSQSNSSSAVTYRIYMWAESTGGSGGIGDGSGNDIIVYGTTSIIGSNQPPSITSIIHTPNIPTSSQSVSVSADVTDTDGTVEGVACYYGTVSGNLTSNIDMSFVSGSTYTTDSDIPAYVDGTTVYYEIYALDDEADETTSPEQSYIVTDPYTGPNAWINEIHYDNDGGDVGEFVEIVIENAGTYTLSNFQVDLYSGGDGASYSTKTLDLFTEGTTIGNFTFYTWEPSSIQNEDEGIALSYKGALIPGQFLSYEGSFTATDGPAIGVTSTDIGVEESGTTPVGFSLQLKGGGDEYALFSWVDPAPETAGALNNGQYFGSNYTTWIGTTDHDWTDASNWNNGVPDASTNAIISQGATYYPTLSGAGSCNNIFIESSANGNASILGNSNLSLSGTTTVERYIESYNTATSGWHNISSPVNNMPISGSDFAPGSTDDLFQWNEVTNTWEHYAQGHFTNFVNGKGYLCAYENSGTKNFVGSLNTAGITFTNLSFTNGGWHLLGNPFASALEWNTGDWNIAGNHVSGTAQIWEADNASYTVINTNEVIPSTNGFFVEVDDATNSITIPASARVHNTINNYKTGNLNNNEETLDLVVTNDTNTFYDHCRIGFKSDATEGWDIEFDAHKLFGASFTSQLWCVANEEVFSQNYLPFVYDTYQVPLYFSAGINATHHITTEGIESFYSNSEIYLEDLLTNELINLSEQQVYTFMATTEDDVQRFVLHFYGVTSIGDSPTVENGKIYAYQNTIYMKFDKLPTDSYQVEVINMVGQQVYAKEFAPAGISSFKLDEKPGVYFVRLRTANKTMVQKVMISK